MKIIEIISKNHIFGYGQISHNPRDYYLDSNGGLLYGYICKEPDAIIKCDTAEIHIKIANGFCIQLATSDGWVLNVPKQLINTASPECCVKAAEEALSFYHHYGIYKNALRAEREAAGLTREQLGKLSGIHPQNIAKWELGERNLENASYSTVIKLAEALQTKPEYILDNTSRS